MSFHIILHGRWLLLPIYLRSTVENILFLTRFDMDDYSNDGENSSVHSKRETSGACDSDCEGNSLKKTKFFAEEIPLAGNL